MAVENLAAAERLFASLLLDQFRPQWLGGFARAWKDWGIAPDRLRRTVGRVADALIAAVDPARVPTTLDRAVFRVQAFKLTRDQGGGELLKPGPPLVLGPRLEPSPTPELPGMPGRWYKYSIGGEPSWKQDPEVPASPIDGRPMTFLAQFPDPTYGTLYAFLDRVHLIATVVKQYG